MPYSIEQVKSLMCEIPAFDDLSPEELETVARIIRVRRIDDGTLLCKEGEHEHSMYYVAAGRIQISKESVDGKQTVLAFFNRGAMVGEMSLIEDTVRSANARAIGTVDVLQLTRADFNELIGRSPQIAIKIIKNIAKSISSRLRYTSGRFADVFR